MSIDSPPRPRKSRPKSKQEYDVSGEILALGYGDIADTMNPKIIRKLHAKLVAIIPYLSINTPEKGTSIMLGSEYIVKREPNCSVFNL